MLKIILSIKEGNMEIILISLLAIIFIALLVPIVIISLNIAREMRRKNDIEDRKVKNDLYRVYMDIDLIRAKELLDTIINEYIIDWVAMNIGEEKYIKDEQVSRMINEVTSEFILEMSDVHLFYIKCIYNVTDDDSLLLFVREKVKKLVLIFITNFNA
jgi:hypothetical protein